MPEVDCEQSPKKPKVKLSEWVGSAKTARPTNHTTCSPWDSAPSAGPGRIHPLAARPPLQRNSDKALRYRIHSSPAATRTRSLSRFRAADPPPPPSPAGSSAPHGAVLTAPPSTNAAAEFLPRSPLDSSRPKGPNTPYRPRTVAFAARESQGPKTAAGFTPAGTPSSEDTNPISAHRRLS